MKLNKKNATVALALTVSLTYTSVLPSVTYAKQSIHSINKDKYATQSQKAQLSKQQKQLKDDLAKIEKKQLALTAEISKGQIAFNRNSDRIAALKDEIGTIQKRIDKRKALLKERLVSVYKNGGSVNYLDVLLGSRDFGDFLDRTKAIFEITSQDQRIITAQKNDKLAVDAKRKTVVKKQAVNVARLESLKKNLAQVQTLQEQKKIASSALASKQSDLSARLVTLAGAAADLQQAQQSVSQTSYSPFQNKTQAESAGNNSGSSSASSSSSAASSAKSAPSAASKPSASSFNLSASAASGGVSGITGYGNRYIGRSTYVFGASSPSTGQFDCSGFVNAAFAANGISVGRSTSALVSTGRAVSYSQAKPGDLVFFDTYKTNGHVGIYLGGGRFIGSQSSTGVAVVSMSNPYWSSHFRGVVRRVLN
ncbi:C40 family peptidase [Sporolactobacillus vineae]|uniref:C40 family peptidase n=1 Tax=Sporolactobacillus vineae TaxID=444463 RepID=UPI000289D21F|nr:C40 family peptidase [Sporolactobacillus vineae]